MMTISSLVMFVLLEYPNSWLIKTRFCRNALSVMVSAPLGKPCHVSKHIPLDAVLRD